MICVLVEKGSENNLRFLLTMDGFKNILSIKRVPYKVVYSISDIDKDERIVILFGLSLKWIEEVIRQLYSLNIHPLVMGSQPRFLLLPCSYITQDYTASFYHLTKYMITNHDDIKKIAFLGFNSDSPHDLYKLEGFLKAIKDSDIEYKVINNDGDSEKMVKDFLIIEDDFDYVIASNDLLAVLYYSLTNKGKDKYLSGFGGSSILKNISKDILTSSIDYKEAGKTLGNVFFFLAKQEHIYPISIKLPSLLRIGNNKYENLETIISSKTEVDFFHNSYIEEIDNLERMFLQMDDLDYDLLRSFMSNEKHEDISDKYFLSLSTIKYRMNKCLLNARVDNKKQLFELFKKYNINL